MIKLKILMRLKKKAGHQVKLINLLRVKVQQMINGLTLAERGSTCFIWCICNIEAKINSHEARLVRGAKN